MGCGTTQAGHYAVRWPRARVVGIDVSPKSIAFAQELKERHRLENLDLRQLAAERVAELNETFDHIVCTGVLHHLEDPDAGLRALQSVLRRRGSINVMVYAPYGRSGVYMLQEYCRRLGIGWTIPEIRDLAQTLRSVPGDHPVAHLLRQSADFANMAGVADALLNPQDRSYSVRELMSFLDGGGFVFGRWIRQAPYLPWCGAIASTPHKEKLAKLPPHDQYAALELFRGTMVRHSFTAYRKDGVVAADAVEFESDEWLDYIPIRMPDTIMVREQLPAGASAVLINRNHTDSDLFLPVGQAEEHLLAKVDGQATVAQVGQYTRRDVLRSLFQTLWRWDHILFDTSRVSS